MLGCIPLIPFSRTFSRALANCNTGGHSFASTCGWFHSTSWNERADVPSFDYQPKDWDNTAVTRGRGLEVLHDPVYNKGTAHPLEERERLGLRGLLPPSVFTMKQQIDRCLERYWHGYDYITDKIESEGGVTHESLRKWHVLQELQDRNETLFYRLLAENFVEMAPIIYTPTIGHVCSYYHRFYRRPRGMMFSAADKGEFKSMVWNWPEPHVSAIVVTDGSRILGLGDLGANGLGISIGKLDLYCAAGGFLPSKVLPVVIDVGTNNESLRNHEWYIGLKQPRLTGDAYYEIMDEFVSAVMGRWPNAVLQFEDFSIEHAHVVLDRYRYSHCVFNDDIQGTAATALSGIMGALAVQGKGPEAIAEQKFVVVGAGSAGMGVVKMIAQAMVKFGLSSDEAASRFYILDKDGLITAQRQGVADFVKPFVRRDQNQSKEGENLLDVIKRTKPTALIGLAGAGRLFCREALSLVAQFNDRPIIFPMSNPTSRIECTSEEAHKVTNGRAIFASGSPQADVEVNGKICAASQANNMYVFPGLAFGALLSNGNIVSDHMLMAAAETLPSLITPEELAQGRVFPCMSNIRNISLHVACNVIKAAAEEGNLNNSKLMRALAKGDGAVRRYVQSKMYWPEYRSLIPPSPGANR